MFATGHSAKSDHTKILERFLEFLKRKETEKENRVEDDLGFEINFGAFQPEQKVSFRAQYFLGSSHLFFQATSRFW